jgi:hypothetical protein
MYVCIHHVDGSQVCVSARMCVYVCVRVYTLCLYIMYTVCMYIQTYIYTYVHVCGCLGVCVVCVCVCVNQKSVYSDSRVNICPWQTKSIKSQYLVPLSRRYTKALTLENSVPRDSPKSVYSDLRS